MAEWRIPVTIIEHHRSALVIAETRAEAIRKARAAEWEFVDDAQRFDVRVVGPCVPHDQDDPHGRAPQRV